MSKLYVNWDSKPRKIYVLKDFVDIYELYFEVCCKNKTIKGANEETLMKSSVLRDGHHMEMIDCIFILPRDRWKCIKKRSVKIKSAKGERLIVHYLEG